MAMDILARKNIKTNLNYESLMKLAEVYTVFEKIHEQLVAE